MRYKYYYSGRQTPELIDWLEQNKIKYTLVGGNIMPELVCFTVLSSKPDSVALIAQLRNMNVTQTTITAEYTPTELSNANWLVIRPRKQCIDIINSREAYDYSCRWTTSAGFRKARHEVQKSLFAIAKEPSVKTSTAFWAPDTGFSEIFTDQRIVDLAKEHNLVGIDFKNVLLKNGNVSQCLYQMTAHHVLDRDYISLGHGEKHLTCPICGKAQYFINDAYQLHLDMSKVNGQNDLYVTERIFGEGRAYPLYIISQRFYQMISSHRLVGNLMISPVVNVNPY